MISTIVSALVKTMDSLTRERLRMDIIAKWIQVKTASKFLDGMKALHQNKIINIYKVQPTYLCIHFIIIRRVIF